MRRLRRGVAEGVELPSHSGKRRRAKLARDEGVSASGLLEHVRDVGGGLVVHAPPAVDKLQAALGDEGSNLGPSRGSLLTPPAREKGHLRVHEGFGGIGEEGVHDAGQDVANGGVLDGGVGAGVVLIHRLEPSDVVVGVRNDVHVEHARNASFARWGDATAGTRREGRREGPRDESEARENDDDANGGPVVVRCRGERCPGASRKGREVVLARESEVSRIRTVGRSAHREDVRRAIASRVSYAPARRACGSTERGG